MRINVYGASCSGKSGFAGEVYGILKKNSVSVELVREICKDWAYQKRIPKDFDQLHLCLSHIKLETQYFDWGINTIITDSPVLLTYIYGEYYNTPCLESHWDICTEYEKRNDSINILLRVKPEQYSIEGRFQSYSEANVIEKMIIQTLNTLEIEYKDERNGGLVSYIVEKLNETKH